MYGVSCYHLLYTAMYDIYSSCYAHRVVVVVDVDVSTCLYEEH